MFTPFREVKFIPTGDINLEDLADYFRLLAVIACGGSRLVERKLIEEGTFKANIDLSRTALEIVKDVRLERGS